MKAEKAILQHIDLLLMQSEDALIGRPGVCANIRAFLFEHASIATKNQIKQKIQNSLGYEPRIKTNRIEIDFDEHDVVIRVIFTFLETGRELVYTSTLRRTL